MKLKERVELWQRERDEQATKIQELTDKLTALSERSMDHPEAISLRTEVASLRTQLSSLEAKQSATEEKLSTAETELASLRATPPSNPRLEDTNPIVPVPGAPTDVRQNPRLARAGQFR